MKVAYVVSRYPAVSHTFVQREVAALRARGIEVETISVRAGTALSDADRAEAATTTTLLPPSRQALVAAGALALRHPRAVTRLAREAVASSAGGPRAALWQLFYSVEVLLLWRHLRRRRVDHVHAHFANVAADIARGTARFGALVGEPVTWSFTMHGPTELADISKFGLVGKARDADAVVCISDFARSQLMALVDETDWRKLVVVHCGVDPERFTPVDRATTDRPLEIVCVGRLVPEKGQALLVEAVAELTRRGIDARLTLVGDGPSRTTIDAAVTRLGLGDRVRLIGSVGQDEILRHYARADVFCLPSFAEGVPVVLMEAMATELPVVTTRIAGIPELVDDGVSGLLVRPGRVDELTDALARLGGDAELRRQLGTAGRKAVLEQFDVRDAGEQLVTVFSNVAALSAAAPS